MLLLAWFSKIHHEDAYNHSLRGALGGEFYWDMA